MLRKTIFIILHNLKALWHFCGNTCAVAEYEIRKFLRTPSELLLRSLQPILWLLIFGEVFAQARIGNLSQQSYLNFLAPGILTQNVLFTAIFHGITVIWERDLGILQKIMATQIPRPAFVLGKAFSAGARVLSQCIVVYIVSWFLGVELNLSPIPLLGVLFFIWISAALFASFSFTVACIVKTKERFLGVGQMLTMPLFFASNAIYPISIMPHWLQVIAHCNPLTYAVDAIRTLMITHHPSVYGLGFDFLILFVLLAAFVIFGALISPRIIR